MEQKKPEISGPVDSTENLVFTTKGLCVGYRGKNGVTVVAKDIDLGLRAGELTAIIGVNGIGKSTLLRTLAKLQPKLSGTITLNGNPMEKYSSMELATLLGIVLTEGPASRHLTVNELVALGRQPYTNWLGTQRETDEAQIHNAMELLELESLGGKSCFELSDGQMQRAMIARVVAQDTPLVFLDEPTTHLDLYHKVRILKLLQFMAHDLGKAVLFTTHEISLALELCDRILILGASEHAFGTPRMLMESGRFDSLFPSDTIRFDKESRTFHIVGPNEDTP